MTLVPQVAKVKINQDPNYAWKTAKENCGAKNVEPTLMTKYT